MKKIFLMLAVLGALAVSDFAMTQSVYADTPGRERRDDRRDNRQDAREDKRECKAGDENSRPECRQEKRDSKQEGRGPDEEEKAPDSDGDGAPAGR
ncbi:MAG: hypothetical protein R3212_12260 [Xanthomonadales bacterium]|nr:hypothetical protein [Xanthomonadales bacterium]